MRINDVNTLKGKVKTALHSWGNNKIDEFFGSKIGVKTFAKNGLNNILNNCDDKINKYIDTMFIFLANERGEVDSDSMVEMMANMFKDIEPCEFQVSCFNIKAGRGEVYIELPHYAVLDMFLGKAGVIKFTADDLLEFKNLFNT